MSTCRTCFYDVPDEVKHKLRSTIAEDDKKLEITDSGCRGIVLYVCN